MIRVHLGGQPACVLHSMCTVLCVPREIGTSDECSELQGTEHALWKPVLLPPMARCNRDNIAALTNNNAHNATQISHKMPYLLHCSMIDLII